MVCQTAIFVVTEAMLRSVALQASAGRCGKRQWQRLAGIPSA